MHTAAVSAACMTVAGQAETIQKEDIKFHSRTGGAGVCARVHDARRAPPQLAARRREACLADAPRDARAAQQCRRLPPDRVHLLARVEEGLLSRRQQLERRPRHFTDLRIANENDAGEA
eukprot:6191197-Pleurochrysis_carterae.AAC.1